MYNLLIFAPVIGRGGVHRMITRQIEHWQKAKVWKVFVLGQVTDEIGEAIDWGSKTTFIQCDGGEPPAHPHLFGWLQRNQEVWHRQWAKVAAEKKINITYFPMPWWTTRLPDFKPVTPFVCTIHDFAWDQLSMPVHEFRAEARNFAEHAALAVFPSDYQREWGEQNYGFRRTKTIYHGHFIPPGFLPTPLEAARVREAYNLPASYVLAFHSFNSKKDPITILRGHLEARRQSAAVPPLVLAGLESEYFAPGSIEPGHLAYGYATKLWKVIDECQYTLGQDLFVVGAVPTADMGGLYAGAKVAVTATLNEGGISGAMFEAFAASVPCVYTDLPMFAERLTPGEYGYVFQPGDQGGFTGALIQACEARSAADEAGEALPVVQNAFSFANRRDWSDAAKDYIAAFEGVLDATKTEA